MKEKVTPLDPRDRKVCKLIAREDRSYRDAYQAVYGKTSQVNMSKFLKRKNVRKYLKKLRKVQRIAHDIDVANIVDDLQTVVKRGLQAIPVLDKDGNDTGEWRSDLNAVTKASQVLLKMAGADVPKKPKITLPDDVDTSSPVSVISALMQSFADREIDDKDMATLLKSLEVMQVYSFGAEIQAQLRDLGLDTDKPSLFSPRKD